MRKNLKRAQRTTMVWRFINSLAPHDIHYMPIWMHEALLVQVMISMFRGKVELVRWDLENSHICWLIAWYYSCPRCPYYIHYALRKTWNSSLTSIVKVLYLSRNGLFTLLWRAYRKTIRLNADFLFLNFTRNLGAKSHWQNHKNLLIYIVKFAIENCSL